MYNQYETETPVVNTQGVKINRMLLVTTRDSYKNIYQRSFNLNGDINTLNKMSAVFSNSGVGNNSSISDVIAAQTMAEAINIASMPLGIANIPNGWGTQRLRFILEVESYTGPMTIVSYLQGFSEYHDPSFTGKVDPTMKFYINSITNVIKTLDPVTGQMVITPKNTLNIITDLSGNKNYTEVERFDDFKLARPIDIMSTYGVLEKYGDMNGETYNHTGVVNSLTETSRRANNDPIKYMTSTLNSYIESKSLTGLTSNIGDISNTACGILNEESVINIPFMFLISRLTNDISPSSFNLNVLNRIDGLVSHKINLIDNVNDLGNIPTNYKLDSDITADMLQPTVETIKSTTFAQSLNSAMLDNLLSNVSLSITNSSGQPVVVITDAKSFIEGINISKFVNNLVSRIKNIILPKITDNNQTIVEIHAHSDILGDTSLTISINMSPSEIYRFPTFADSLYSPVVTNSSTKESLVNDFGNLLDLTYNV